MPRGKANKDALKGCKLHGQFRGNECPSCIMDKCFQVSAKKYGPALKALAEKDKPK
jgi:hypothetical protein